MGGIGAEVGASAVWRWGMLQGIEKCADSVCGPEGGEAYQWQKTCASQTATKGIGPTFQNLKQLGAPMSGASPTQLQS